MSGVDLGTRRIRKGSADAIERYLGEAGLALPAGVRQLVDDVARRGATPLVVQAYWAAGGSDWFDDGPRAQALVDGWKRACERCRVAWGGGETPALAGIVEAGRIDLAASCTGCTCTRASARSAL